MQDSSSFTPRGQSQALPAAFAVLCLVVMASTANHGAVTRPTMGIEAATVSSRIDRHGWALWHISHLVPMSKDATDAESFLTLGRVRVSEGPRNQPRTWQKGGTW